MLILLTHQRVKFKWRLTYDLIIALLLYAGDLASMAESEEDLQSLLNILEKWCKQSRTLHN